MVYNRSAKLHIIGGIPTPSFPDKLLPPSLLSPSFYKGSSAFALSGNRLSTSQANSASIASLHVRKL
jgi:hypothetical protein